jgi:hypothetical protein
VGVSVGTGVSVTAGSGVAVQAVAVSVKLAITVCAALVSTNLMSGVGLGGMPGAHADSRNTPIKMVIRNFIFIEPLD